MHGSSSAGGRPASWAVAGLFAAAAGLSGGCYVTYAAAWNPPRAVVLASEPPPAPAEMRPAAPYEGAVWVAGHYDWAAEGWVWLPGTYVRPRAGHIWVAPIYQRERERVRYVPGHWRPTEVPPPLPAQGSPPPPTVVPAPPGPRPVPVPAPVPVPVPAPGPPPPTIVP
jgi:hypothetical protein